MSKLTSFSLGLAAIILFFVAADYGVFYGILKQAPSIWIYVSLGFLFGSNVLIHYILLKAGDKRPQLFVTYFMGTVSAKLFIYLGFLVVMALLDRENIVPNMLHFLLLYLVTTAFEIVRVLKDLRGVS